MSIKFWCSVSVAIDLLIVWKICWMKLCTTMRSQWETAVGVLLCGLVFELKKRETDWTIWLNVFRANWMYNVHWTWNVKLKEGLRRDGCPSIVGLNGSKRLSNWSVDILRNCWLREDSDALNLERTICDCVRVATTKRIRSSWFRKARGYPSDRIWAENSSAKWFQSKKKKDCCTMYRRPVTGRIE